MPLDPIQLRAILRQLLTLWASDAVFDVAFVVAILLGVLILAVWTRRLWSDLLYGLGSEF